ncbi:MAG TPA: FtsX-like permease family protein, partial [Flavisolibacter sp.]|nr:FtsX-like permease family protein [Flavisolibacter sp.]
VTGSNVNLGRGKDGGTTRSHVTFDYGSKPISSNLSYVDYDYLKTLGIPLKEGRDFDKSFGTDTADNVLLSESAAAQYGEKDLIGRNLMVDSNARPWHVVGIFADFHLYSMHEKVEPLTLLMNNKEGLRYCLIRVAPQQLLSAMELVKKEMAVLQPGVEFRGTFVDENISNWYKQEQAMSLLFSIASLIAILLSCTGLLAMVLLVTRQRTKEIGVRKVLGASARNIAMLLSKSFLSLVLISILIATPLSWLLMHKWLEGFAYRISLEWWMFVLVAMSALAVAMLTISVNTIRVARRNPVKSLRTE